MTKVIGLKLAKQEQEKTLKEVMELIHEEHPEINEYRIGLLVIEDKTHGLRMFPLKDSSCYEYIGLLEAAKGALIDNMYDEE